MNSTLLVKLYMATPYSAGHHFFDLLVRHDTGFNSFYIHGLPRRLLYIVKINPPHPGEHFSGIKSQLPVKMWL